MKSILKYLTLFLLGFIFCVDVALSKDSLSPEVQEFKRLAGKVISTQKASNEACTMTLIFKEAIKIGGSIGLFSLANHFATYEVKDFADDATTVLTKLLAVFQSAPTKVECGKKLTISQLAPIVFVITVVFFLIPCDLLIYKRDKSVAVMQKLQAYVESLSYDQQRLVAEVFKDEYERSLQRKLVKDKDDASFVFGQMEFLLLDLFLPLFPIVIFAKLCGWDLSCIKHNLNILANDKGFIGNVFKFFNEDDVRLPAWHSKPVLNIYVLMAGAIIFILNIPITVSRISNSSENKKKCAWIQIKKALS